MTFAMMDTETDTESSCMFCMETPFEELQERLYCRSCGKPACISCAATYRQNIQSAGMGCPCCRSTMDVLYIVSDAAHDTHIVLRLDGNYLDIDLSKRAERRAIRGIRNSFSKVVGSNLKKWIQEKKFEYMSCMKDAIRSFLSEEAKRNPRLKAMVGDRFTSRDNNEVKNVYFVFVNTNVVNYPLIDNVSAPWEIIIHEVEGMTYHLL